MNVYEKREGYGRRLMVEFTCRRCGKTELRTLDECMNEVKEGYAGLHDLKPPKGWKDGGIYDHMFCPDCKKAYEQFMNPNKEKAEE